MMKIWFHFFDFIQYSLGNISFLLYLFFYTPQRQSVMIVLFQNTFFFLILCFWSQSWGSSFLPFHCLCFGFSISLLTFLQIKQHPSHSIKNVPLPILKNNALKYNSFPHSFHTFKIICQIKTKIGFYKHLFCFWQYPFLFSSASKSIDMVIKFILLLLFSLKTFLDN